MSKPTNAEPTQVELGRRRFCAALAVLGASGCSGPANQIAVGALDSGFGGSSQGPAPGGDLASNPNADLASSGSEDLAHNGKEDLASTGSGKGDMATGGSSSCSGNVAGGAASAVVAGTPVYVSSGHIFVCRDSGGLYAMSSKCTHQGCKLTPEATQFYCNCHGATFDLNGQNPTSPAYNPLDHYALCVNASGDVEVDTSSVVDASTRTA